MIDRLATPPTSKSLTYIQNSVDSLHSRSISSKSPATNYEQYLTDFLAVSSTVMNFAMI